MVTCDQCGEQVSGAAVFSCNFCDKRLCPDCRLPEKHSCSGLAAGAAESAGTPLSTDPGGPDGSWSRKAARALRTLWRPKGYVLLAIALVVFAGTIGTGFAPLDDRAEDVFEGGQDLVDSARALAESSGNSDSQAPPTENEMAGNGDSSDSSSPGAGDQELNETAIARAAHERVNEIRSDRGLSALAWSPQLHDVAERHSEDMASRGYFSHTGPDGADFSDRYELAGVECRVQVSDNRYMTGAENIAYTYADIDVQTDSGVVNYDNNETAIGRGLVRQWMNSQEHRENMLKPYWNTEGIGVGISSVDGREQVYLTQNFC